MTSDDLYLLKGVLYLISTVLVIAHMNQTWGNVETWGRRLRYYVLLELAILGTAASVGQIQAPSVGFPWYQYGSLTLATLLIVAMLVSIREDRRR